MLTAFALAALVAGFTGSWSPCGFSMIDTLGPGGYGRRRATRVAASAAFVPGALAGGLVSFGGLALLGSLVHAGIWPALALGILAFAALLEAGGARVRPQVRRQVPEAWRRVLPLPLAAFGYGVLLGLGWTTYVLTLAVWALFALAFALGDPVLGVVAGLAFGLGRAVPIVLLSWTVETGRGERVAAAMAERPALLRGVRAADAVALVAVAVVLAPTAASAAAPTAADPAIDPSADRGDLAYDQDGQGIVRRGGATLFLPGGSPAVGGDRVAWRDGSTITVADRRTLTPRVTLEAPGANKLAVSHSYVVWRTSPAAGDRIWVQRIGAPGRATTRIAATDAPTQLGRPVISGSVVAYHVASGAGSTVRTVDLATGRRRIQARGVRGQVLNPAFGPGVIGYSRLTYCRQRWVERSRRGGRERTLLTLGPLASRDALHGEGHTTQGSEPSRCRPRALGRSATMLWTAALTRRFAYLTLVRGSAHRIVRLTR